MVLFDKFIDLFYDHAAVVNEDEQALQEEVQLLRKKYGSWFKVRGFADYKEFFLAVHMARLNHCPITVAFLKNTDPAGVLILKKSDPTIQTYTYSTTQELATHLPTLR
jgi:hypothetical protein